LIEWSNFYVHTKYLIQKFLVENVASKTFITRIQTKKSTSLIIFSKFLYIWMKNYRLNLALLLIDKLNILLIIKLK